MRLLYYCVGLIGLSVRSLESLTDILLSIYNRNAIRVCGCARQTKPVTRSQIQMYTDTYTVGEGEYIFLQSIRPNIYKCGRAPIVNKSLSFQ
jgi:hypothetical protein